MIFFFAALLLLKKKKMACVHYGERYTDGQCSSWHSINKNDFVVVLVFRNNDFFFGGDKKPSRTRVYVVIFIL